MKKTKQIITLRNLHQSAKTLKPLTGDDHFLTMQCFAGRSCVPTSMWIYGYSEQDIPTQCQAGGFNVDMINKLNEKAAVSGSFIPMMNVCMVMFRHSEHLVKAREGSRYWLNIEKVKTDLKHETGCACLLVKI